MPLPIDIVLHVIALAVAVIALIRRGPRGEQGARGEAGAKGERGFDGPPGMVEFVPPAATTLPPVDAQPLEGFIRAAILGQAAYEKEQAVLLAEQAKARHERHPKHGIKISGAPPYDLRERRIAIGLRVKQMLKGPPPSDLAEQVAALVTE